MVVAPRRVTYTVKKNPDKLPDRTGLPRYFQIEPDLNPVDG